MDLLGGASVSVVDLRSSGVGVGIGSGFGRPAWAWAWARPSIVRRWLGFRSSSELLDGSSVADVVLRSSGVGVGLRSSSECGFRLWAGQDPVLSLASSELFWPDLSLAYLRSSSFD